ncbi:MAG: hypothetical protein HZC40_26230, partial [Chloroflexi bacterium]|nr:hypothetical protein [Chloroflexota bacterium]
WYGRTYNIALEPFSSVQPNIASAMQAGSAHVLEPGQGIQAQMTAAAFAGIRGVSRISLNGDVVARTE